MMASFAAGVRSWGRASSARGPTSGSLRSRHWSGA